MWSVLPLGLYRRVHPATALKASPQTVAALQLAAGPPVRGEETVHNRALVSYVYSNPPPHTRLAEHDMVYVLRPEGGVGGVVVSQGWGRRSYERILSLCFCGHKLPM